MIMPARAMVPSMATKPNGFWNNSRKKVTPISPSGAVIKTINDNGKLRSCNISKVITTRMNSGIPAFTDFCPRADSSTVPPTCSK